MTHEPNRAASPPPTTAATFHHGVDVYDDDYGFRLEGMNAHCRHCDAGGQYTRWPQWKRQQHFEQEHKDARRLEHAARRRAHKALRAERDAISREYTEAPPPAASAASEARNDRRHRSRQWAADHRPRACRQCGGEFIPADPRQIHCTPQCRKRYAYEQAKTRRNPQRDPPPSRGHEASTEPRARATTPVTKRGADPRQCEHCGATYTPRRTDQRYHTAACRQAAHRARHETADPTTDGTTT